jgi:hypothetical protein
LPTEWRKETVLTLLILSLVRPPPSVGNEAVGVFMSVNWMCRTGVSAVIADLTTNYAVDETMMLFPDKNKKSRQMRLYEQLNLKDSMPLVSADTEIFSHEYASASAIFTRN